jgi:4,5:9,10-diseco-3-hydroxy-5,9,17-trioxoandrosta-1(10),2-diene-4-oate hydrolase
MANICHDPRSVGDEMLLVQLTSYALPDRFSAYKATIEGMIASLSSADPEQHRVYARLDRIKAPTLVLTGREDVRADVKMHEAGVKRMPNARLVIFERCGHLPYMEYPERFNTVVTGFMTGADA